MRLTKLSLAFAALALSASAAACASDASGDSVLNHQVCTEADLGGSYIEKTVGDVSIGNLADLSSDSSARSRELTQAGMVEGRFAYWVHTVPNPPFDPPLEVVCQAIEFHSAQEATAFVHDIKPTPDDLASNAIAWLADDHRSVEELQRSGASTAGPVRREFKVTATGNSLHVTIYATIEADGRFVRTIYVGKNAGGAPVTANDPEKIGAAIARRLK